MRDIIDRQEYFANGRYQIGPRWAVYGTLDDSYIKNLGTGQEFNDLDLETGKVGVEMATSQANTIGAEYRFTHGRYPHQDGATLNGQPFDPDYNENSGVVLIKYAPTDKTTFNADAGYLQRNYPDNPGVWRVFRRHLAPEVSMAGTTEQDQPLGDREPRDLQAYLYAQSDYFVQDGVSVSPVWMETDKITWVAVVAWYKQDYIESSFSNIVVGPRRRHPLGGAGRHSIHTVALARAHPHLSPRAAPFQPEPVRLRRQPRKRRREVQVFDGRVRPARTGGDHPPRDAG